MVHRISMFTVVNSQFRTAQAHSSRKEGWTTDVGLVSSRLYKAISFGTFVPTSENSCPLERAAGYMQWKTVRFELSDALLIDERRLWSSLSLMRMANPLAHACFPLGSSTRQIRGYTTKNVAQIEYCNWHSTEFNQVPAQFLCFFFVLRNWTCEEKVVPQVSAKESFSQPQGRRFIELL